MNIWTWESFTVVGFHTISKKLENMVASNGTNQDIQPRGLSNFAYKIITGDEI